jgi:hypothetical protein
MVLLALEGRDLVRSPLIWGSGAAAGSGGGGGGCGGWW